MAVMMGNLYDALRSAGADDEKAWRAAEELAGYESRFSNLEGDNAILKWMVGLNIGLTLFVSGLVLKLVGVR